jgi:acetyltransferase-like isoleucine patch superfamily enzyme
MPSEGKNLVGVDIGSSSIKICEIGENRKGSRQLVRFGYHSLPPQTFVDGHVMNSGAIVEHDCALAHGVHVSPGAVLSGGVNVGARTWIGAGASVIQGIVIGADVTIGAGAVVIRDVPDGVTVVGVPARDVRGA